MKKDLTQCFVTLSHVVRPAQPNIWKAGKGTWKTQSLQPRAPESYWNKLRGETGCNIHGTRMQVDASDNDQSGTEKSLTCLILLFMLALKQYDATILMGKVCHVLFKENGISISV